MVPRAMKDWTQGTRIGAYELQRPLGEGAAAVVWLATLQGVGGFRKQVALKLIKGVVDDNLAEALYQEARLTALLSHPNVVDVLAVERTDGQLFLAMEYVPGGTLRQLVSRVKKAHVGFPQSVVVDLCVDIGRGLGYAHAAVDATGAPLSILHRDVKPENVLIDRDGAARITDFGLAKTLDSGGSTAADGVRGTAKYVAPEIWRGSRDIRPRADLFALGCILHELVTLRRLFDGPVDSIVQQMKSRRPAQEAEQVAAAAPDFAPIFERLVQRDPDRRYQSAEEVIADLEALRRRRGAEADVATFTRLVQRRIDGPGDAPEPALDDRLRASADPRWAALAPPDAVPTSPSSPPPASTPSTAQRWLTLAIVATAGAIGLAAAALAVLSMSA